MLSQIGVPFRVIGAAVDEAQAPGEPPDDYVMRLAAAKAGTGWMRTGEGPAPVLGADTAVVLDGKILGKPADEADLVRMLDALSARSHQVLTAVALCSAAGTSLRLSRSEVTMRAIEAAEARAYWQTGESADKAGGYAIQGYAAVFIEDLRGSYSGVMGLPLFETAQLLGAANLPRWRRP